LADPPIPNRAPESTKPEGTSPPETTANLSSSNIPSANRLFKFIENGFTQTVIGITAGVMAIFVYGPIFTVCSVLTLMGLHRSGAVEGLSTRRKVGWYVVLALVSGGLFLWCGRIIEHNRDHIPTPSEISATVKAASKGPSPTPSPKDGRDTTASSLGTPAPAKTEITAELAPFAWNWYSTAMIRLAPDQEPQEEHGLSYGLVAILMIRNNGSESVQVQALEVIGDAPISEQDWGSILNFTHRQFSRAEFNQRQPFVELSWIVWPKEQIIVGPHDQKFIPFVIANPKNEFERSFSVLPGLRGSDGGMVYVGLRNPEKRPIALVRIPTIWPIIRFTSYIKSPVQTGNNEFRNPTLTEAVISGSIRFRVRLSSERYVISPKAIRAAQLVLQDEWEQGDVPIQDLFYGRLGWSRAEPIKKDPLMDIPK
jgi:hypothetical protein